MPRRSAKPLSELTHQQLLAYGQEMSSENKSMRRQLTRLRGKVSEYESGMKVLGLKVKSALTEYGKEESADGGCPECGAAEKTSVLMVYKDAHKCKKCGKLWLTEHVND